MRKYFSFCLLATLCALVAAGCSSPLYREARIAAPRDKGLVLIYWPASDDAQSDKTNFTKVYVNDELIEKHLRPGTFCSYKPAPGTLKISSGKYTGNKPGDYVRAGIWGGPERMAGVFAAQKMDRAVLNIMAGETYFFETRAGMVSEKMQQVSRGQGERGIEQCRWVNR